MYRFKNIQSVQNRISACVRAIKTTANTASNSERIVLPKRISRSPTDILYALSCTVGRDPTAPHYKYHDDPFLIPYSEQEKETFALAQEAGKKAARSIKQEWPQLFEVSQMLNPNYILYSNEKPKKFASFLACNS